MLFLCLSSFILKLWAYIKDRWNHIAAMIRIVEAIVIFGSGGWGREVLGIIEAINAKNPCWHILGFLDDDPDTHGSTIAGQKVLGGSGWLRDKHGLNVVLGIGSSIPRKQTAESLSRLYPYIQFPILIHPLAYVGPRVSLGEGSVLHAYSVATVDLHMGRHNLLNVAAVVSHECHIGDYVSIHPHASVSGKVTLGEAVELGTGTQVIPGIRIGDYTMTGAGSVVVKSLEACCLAVGIPAKPVKHYALPTFVREPQAPVPTI